MIPTRPSLTPREQRLTEGVITHLPLFAGVPPQGIQVVARRCSIVDACRGDVIAPRGTRLAGVFAVAYGTVKLALRSADAEQRVLRVLAAGHTFGEPYALLARPCGYDALAVTECKLIVMPPETISDCAERYPRFSRNLLTALAERSLDLLATFEAATLLRGAQRLASYLDGLAGPNGAPGRVVIQLPVSKTMLAAQLGVKKETLSRLLRQLTVRGLIEVSRREVAILDRQGLTASVSATA